MTNILPSAGLADDNSPPTFVMIGMGDEIKPGRVHQAPVSDDVPESILMEAFGHTRGDRAKAYAHPFLNFARTAILWEFYLRMVGVIPQPGHEPKPLTPEHVAYMMSLLKTAREVNAHRRDNQVDNAGYVDCADRIHEAMIRLGYANGIEDLRRMNHQEITDLFNRAESYGPDHEIWKGI